jgi:hypothetical protein
LGVPLDISSFTSSLIKDVSLKDVQHVDFLFKIGDVQISFGIITYCFMQRPSYFLRCTPPSSTFIKSFISFDSSLLQVFIPFLGLGSFDNLEGPLTHKQTFLLITFSGIRFTLMATIVPIAYLGIWALVILIIVVRFMVDQHPFLIEALTRIENNTFPFQQHLKAACELLLPLARAHVFFLFEQFIKQQMFRPQNSILECLHHHTLCNMFFNKISETHHA